MSKLWLLCLLTLLVSLLELSFIFAYSTAKVCLRAVVFLCSGNYSYIINLTITHLIFSATDQHWSYCLRSLILLIHRNLNWQLLLQGLYWLSRITWMGNPSNIKILRWPNYSLWTTFTILWDLCGGLFYPTILLSR